MQENFLLIIDAEIQNTKAEKTTLLQLQSYFYVLFLHLVEQRSMARGITIH